MLCILPFLAKVIDSFKKINNKEKRRILLNSAIIIIRSFII